MQKLFVCFARCALFCLLPHSVCGQDGIPIRDTLPLRIINQAIFECDIQLPADYSRDKGYPLLVALHGGGGSFKNFRGIWDHFVDPQFIMATPQAPYKWLLHGEIGYDWSAWPSRDTAYMKEAISLSSSYIGTTIKTLKESYSVNQVFLLGFSQGAIIAQTAGIDNHALINGIIILSGPEIYHPGKAEIVWPSLNEIRDANHLRIFIAHGKADEAVDFELAEKSINQYACWGYDVSMFDFEGGHEISGSAMVEIQKWMAETPAGR